MMTVEPGLGLCESVEEVMHSQIEDTVIDPTSLQTCSIEEHELVESGSPLQKCVEEEAHASTVDIPTMNMV